MWVTSIRLLIPRSAEHLLQLYRTLGNANRSPNASRNVALYNYYTRQRLYTRTLKHNKITFRSKDIRGIVKHNPLFTIPAASQSLHDWFNYTRAAMVRGRNPCIVGPFARSYV